MKLFAGIDVGSRTVKIVIADPDRDNRIVAKTVEDQAVDQKGFVRKLFTRLTDEHNIDRNDITGIVATGYGRKLVEIADTTITEITCHSAGVRCLSPQARTIVDIGGQDSKVIFLDEAGQVRDFAMNDRCAAGTGRFLEIVARRMETDISDLGKMAARSTNPAAISSMCVVFAETEIVGLMADGVAPSDIVSGVQSSIASRINSMLAGQVQNPVIFTGGVALLPSMADELGRITGCNITVSPEPQITGALGAAILAGK